MSGLAGKVAVVSGASRGIGAAVAAELAAAGADLALIARSAEGLRGVSAAVEACGRRSLPLACDVADWASVSAAFAAVRESLGPVDILVNNAGTIEPIGRIEDADPALWRRSLEVNLLGAFNCLRAAIHDLRERRGVVVNLSSGAAHTPREGWSAYCSAKAGLAMLTRTIAHEYGGSGVRAYGFQPGVVDTEMQGLIRQSGINEISRLRRDQLRPVTEPARAVAWLCSDEAADLAGQELSIADQVFATRPGSPAPN